MKGVPGFMEKTSRVEVSIMGRVSVMDKGEEMEVDDIAIAIKGMKEVETKSGESEQGIA